MRTVVETDLKVFTYGVEMYGPKVIYTAFWELMMPYKQLGQNDKWTHYSMSYNLSLCSNAGGIVSMIAINFYLISTGNDKLEILWLTFKENSVINDRIQCNYVKYQTDELNFPYSYK